jgi:hypothetical protein
MYPTARAYRSNQLLSASDRAATTERPAVFVEWTVQ